MIEKTLDVTELPIAETVKDGDQLLLVRTQKNGVKAPMRMKAKKQKKQQIVIGRAIRPRACQIGGVENWYVFGTAPYFTNILLLNIAPMSVNVWHDFGYDRVVLNITEQQLGDIFVFKQDVTNNDRSMLYMTFWASNNTAQTLGWDNLFVNAECANAFRVDSYDLTERVLTLNLTHKYLLTADLRGTSTHHYFKDGVRRWHISKKLIVKNAFGSEYYTTYNGLVILKRKPDDIILQGENILVKKKITLKSRLQFGLGSEVSSGRQHGIVVSYSKVTRQGDKSVCVVNGAKKRRPFGKYKIWAIHRWNRRKSDEYLHCRMKCVGLGKKKKVEQGPCFDEYRVTVREI
jgi:hypothetical protein|nr:MAG TPA: hypothetical protein [Caudoviricetes sp.]